MNRQLRQFLGLSRREQKMLVQAFCLSGIVRLAVLILPFRCLSPLLGSQTRESPWKEDMVNLKAARMVGQVVETVSRYTPWQSRCLVQAIVGKILLRQLAVANTLYLGVGREEKKIVAHAWLRCGAVILTGSQGREAFTVVGKFADGWEDPGISEIS